MTRPEWDVVAIGTGMGGSAGGAVCAMHGLKTLILEKNPRPGGSCSCYEKKGFHLNIRFKDGFRVPGIEVLGTVIGCVEERSASKSL